jgi:sulfonate transport system substrate-binding protein
VSKFSRGLNSKDVLDIILDQINEVDKWAQDNQQEVASILAPALGIDEAALVQALAHRTWGVVQVSDATLVAQQSIADTFFELELIPEAIDVKEATLK